MASLGKALQDTIRNLEQLQGAQDSSSDAVRAKLDTLYAQQIELIEAAINRQTEEYQAATAAMEEAAAKTQEAIDDIAKLDQSLTLVANALGKVATLIARFG